MVSALTSTGLPFDLLVAAYFTWLGSEIVGAQLFARWRARDAQVVRRTDRASGLAIVVGVLLSLVVISALAYHGLANLPLSVVYVGLGLMFVGVALRQWAIAVLGRYFSTTIRVLDIHRVVSGGPYRLVRHPSYTGAVLTLLGLGLAGGSWEGVIAVVGTAAVVFGYRIHVEERFLVDQLGPEYAAYRARTKRLIPFLL